MNISQTHKKVIFILTIVALIFMSTFFASFQKTEAQSIIGETVLLAALRDAIGQDAYDALIAETGTANVLSFINITGFNLAVDLIERAGPLVTGQFINTAGVATVGSLVVHNGGFAVGDFINQTGASNAYGLITETSVEDVSSLLRLVGAEELGSLVNTSGVIGFGGFVESIGMSNFRTIYTSIGANSFESLNSSLGPATIERMINELGGINSFISAVNINGTADLIEVVQAVGVAFVAAVAVADGIAAIDDILRTPTILPPQLELPGQSPEFLEFIQLRGQAEVDALIAEFGLDELELMIRRVGATELDDIIDTMGTDDYIALGRAVGLDEAADLFVAIEGTNYDITFNEFTNTEIIAMAEALGAEEFAYLFFAMEGRDFRIDIRPLSTTEIIGLANALGFGGLAEIYFILDGANLDDLIPTLRTRDYIVIAESLGLGGFTTLIENTAIIDDLLTGPNALTPEELAALLLGGEVGSLVGLITGDVLTVEEIKQLVEDFGADALAAVLDSVGLGELEEYINLNGLGALGDILSGDVSLDTIASLFGFGSNNGEIPFGGIIAGPTLLGVSLPFPIPCSCSSNGFIVGEVNLVAGGGGITAPNLFFNLFKSRLFPNYRPRKGRLTLGLHDGKPGTDCKTGIWPACFVVPYEATINIIGTN